jgi:hypothetical protein
MIKAGMQSEDDVHISLAQNNISTVKYSTSNYLGEDPVEQTAVADVMNQTFKKVQGSEWE